MKHRCHQSSDRRLVIDLLILLLVSCVAQATHFSYKQGRAVLNGDSAQYVASAEALLQADQTPHFEMRKPGYILFLAGVALALGNMGWAAIAANHFLLAFLPLIAYGFGRHLRGRWLGWLAATLVLVRLQFEFRADRIMSECLYTLFLSAALLWFVIGLNSKRRIHWLVASGTCMGVAWFSRSAALPVVVVCAIVLIVIHRTQPRISLATVASFLLPVALFVATECGLNRAFAGQFRPSNGTAGAMVLLRARHFQGFDWPTTPEAQSVIDFLPERSKDDAYVSHLLDVWVARHRAVRDQKMTEWAYDAMMRDVGLQMIAANKRAYLWSSMKIAAFHLMRRPDGMSLSPVPASNRMEPLVPHAVASGAEKTDHWFAYWGLPHLSQVQSAGLVDRMEVAATTKAPVGDGKLWAFLRYGISKSPMAEILEVLNRLSHLWPGIALLLFPFLGLRRSTCLLFAVIYLVDALFIGLVTPTSLRIQFPWIVIDTVLVGGVVVGLANLLIFFGKRTTASTPEVEIKDSGRSSLPARS